MLKNVYLWSNGMVMAFDEQGQQMPDLQGTIEEVHSKVQQAANEGTIWHKGIWRQGTREVSPQDILGDREEP